jgi:hypothetical protein
VPGEAQTSRNPNKTRKILKALYNNNNNNRTTTTIFPGLWRFSHIICGCVCVYFGVVGRVCFRFFLDSCILCCCWDFQPKLRPRDVVLHFSFFISFSLGVSAPATLRLHGWLNNFDGPIHQQQQHTAHSTHGTIILRNILFPIFFFPFSQVSDMDGNTVPSYNDPVSAKKSAAQTSKYVSAETQISA